MTTEAKKVNASSFPFSKDKCSFNQILLKYFFLSSIILLIQFSF